MLEHKPTEQKGTPIEGIASPGIGRTMTCQIRKTIAIPFKMPPRNTPFRERLQLFYQNVVAM
jgi:hypothetical protein